MNSIGRWFLALSHLKTCLNLRFMCGKWMRWIYFKNHLPGSNECCSGHLWSNTFSPFPVSWDIWSLIILDHDRNHQVMVGIIHYWSHILSDLIWYHYSMPFDSGRIFHDSTLFFWSHILSESSIIITNKNPKKRFLYAFAACPNFWPNFSIGVRQGSRVCEAMMRLVRILVDPGRNLPCGTRVFLGGPLGDLFLKCQVT